MPELITVTATIDDDLYVGTAHGDIDDRKGGGGGDDF